MSSIIKATTLGVDGTLAKEEELLIAEPVMATADAPLVSVLSQPRQRGALTLLRKARQRANALLAQARADAEQIREQARAEGYTEGLQQGREQGISDGTTEGAAIGWESAVSQAQDTLRTAKSLLVALEAERQKAFTGLEQVVAELALAIAEKIVQREIAQDDEYIPRLVSNALQTWGPSDHIVARVHPGSLEQMADIGKDLANRLQFVADDSLAPGDCVIESDAGLLDGKLDSRLASIRQALESAAMK